MPAGSLRHEDVITCLPTGLVSCYAVFAGFVASHSVCSHDSRPENPSGEGTAETEVSPDRKGGRMGKSRGKKENAEQYYRKSTTYTLLLLQLPRGHVWGRGQWLWGPESRRCRRVSVWGRGFGGFAFHFQVWKHQLCAAAYQVPKAFGLWKQVKYWKWKQTINVYDKNVVCAERAAVLWSPPSASSDTWPCTAWFSSAPSSSSTQWVEKLFCQNQRSVSNTLSLSHYDTQGHQWLHAAYRITMDIKCSFLVSGQMWRNFLRLTFSHVHNNKNTFI